MILTLTVMMLAITNLLIAWHCGKLSKRVNELEHEQEKHRSVVEMLLEDVYKDEG